MPLRLFPLLIGVVGTGFIARGFIQSTLRDRGMRVSAVLTRRPKEAVRDIDPALLVAETDEMLEKCDMIVECSGDVIHATRVVDAALSAGKPVVTMNSEFHVTTGSWFQGRGILTEAEGDQSGCLAALGEEAEAMGFRPLVYGNTKRFMNLHPTPQEMEYWAAKQGVRLDQCTAFTDGTKVHVEQAVVSNGLGGSMARGGMAGPRTETVREGAGILAQRAIEAGMPISDYLVTPEAPGSVFIVATHDDVHSPALEYFKMGAGPHYLLMKPHHLCYLEIAKTIRRIQNGGPVLLNNGETPRLSVGSVAKRDLKPGERIERGLGSFVARGETVAIREATGHVPIGLLQEAVVRRPVKAGSIITMDHVDLPDTLALRAWQEIERRVLGLTLKQHVLPLASIAAIA